MCMCMCVCVEYEDQGDAAAKRGRGNRHWLDPENFRGAESCDQGGQRSNQRDDACRCWRRWGKGTSQVASVRLVDTSTCYSRDIPASLTHM